MSNDSLVLIPMFFPSHGILPIGSDDQSSLIITCPGSHARASRSVRLIVLCGHHQIWWFVACLLLISGIYLEICCLFLGFICGYCLFLEFICCLFVVFHMSPWIPVKICLLVPFSRFHEVPHDFSPWNSDVCGAQEMGLREKLDFPIRKAEPREGRLGIHRVPRTQDAPRSSSQMQIPIFPIYIWLYIYRCKFKVLYSPLYSIIILYLSYISCVLFILGFELEHLARWPANRSCNSISQESCVQLLYFQGCMSFYHDLQ